jgi:hypothetical protein
MRIFRTIWVRLAIVALLSIGTAHADDWIGGNGSTLSALEPLATYEGGVIRVFLPNPMNVPYCGNSSGQTSTFHFLLSTNGSSSAMIIRPALLQALGCTARRTPALLVPSELMVAWQP